MSTAAERAYGPARTPAVGGQRTLNATATTHADGAPTTPTKSKGSEPKVASEKPRQAQRSGATPPGTATTALPGWDVMERRAFGTQGLQVRSEEERILSGILVPYGSPTKIGSFIEEFRAEARSPNADPEQVPLLTGHEHASLPVGRTLTLTDAPHALTGEWRVAETQAGDEVMALARDGVPLSLSIGFRPTNRTHGPLTAPTSPEYSAHLGEVSLVGVGAYEDAKVTSVRADEQLSDASDIHPRLTITRLSRP